MLLSSEQSMKTVQIFLFETVCHFEEQDSMVSSSVGRKASDTTFSASSEQYENIY
jgi:hypothetical protein